MMILAFTGKACSIVFFFGAWWFYIPPKQQRNQTEKKSNKFNLDNPQQHVVLGNGNINRVHPPNDNNLNNKRY